MIRLTFILLNNNRAVSITVTCESRSTHTVWQMVYHLTLCILATYSWAWINASISYTRLIRRAIGVQCTFWSTTFVWIAEILGYALTRTGAVLFTANSVRATWIWNARIHGWLVLNRSLFNCALNERIAYIVSEAFTNWSMTDNMTLGILTTYAFCARIFTVSIDTSKVTGAFRTSYTLRSTVRGLTDKIGQTIARVTISIHATFSVGATG